jgi:ferredoxin
MLQVTVFDSASGRREHFEASADEPLLDQLERSCSFQFPNLCWMGACGTCALRVACGIEHLDRDAFGIGATVDTEPGYILPCAAAPAERVITVADHYHVTVEAP